MKLNNALVDLIENIMKKLATTGGALILITGFFTAGFSVGEKYEKDNSILALIENNNKHYLEVIDLKKQINFLELEIKFINKNGKKESVKRRY